MRYERSTIDPDGIPVPLREGGDVLDRIARAAAHCVRAPVARITRFDIGRSHPVGEFDPMSWLRRVRSAPIQPLLDRVVETGRPLLIEDVAAASRPSADAAVGKTGIRAFAGVPVVGGDGRPVATLYVVDSRRRSWAPDTATLLDDLAACAAALLDGPAPVAATARGDRALRDASDAWPVLDALDASVALVDPDGTLVDVNRAASRGLGGEDAWWRGRPLWEVFPGSGYEDGAAAIRRGVRTAADGESARFDIDDHRSANGLGGSYTVRIVPLRDGDGTPSRLVAVFTDVTDRRRAEAVRHRDAREEAMRAAEREARRKIEEVLESVTEAVFVLDREWRFVFLNDRAAEHLGRDGIDLLGSNLFEEFPKFDRASVRQALRRAVEENGPVTFCTDDVLGADGRVEYRACPAADGLTVYCRDITSGERTEEALRISESHLSSLIENASDVLAIVDREGTIRYESTSVERVLGYSPPELIGRDISGLVHPEDRIVAERLFRDALDGGHFDGSLEMRIRHKDESWRNMEVTGSILGDRSRAVGLLVHLRDITQRRRTEAALRESEAQLRQAQKMEAVGRLAGGIAHDFNNLMMTISGYAEVLLRRIHPDDPNRADIQAIEFAAGRAAELTGQLLAFSREQVLQPQVLDLNDLVGDLERMLTRVIGEHIMLRTDLDPDLGRVKADPVQIEQVILNLAVNARDAMPDGGTLTLETRNDRLAEEDDAGYGYDVRTGPYVRVSVRDTGEGMDAEMQERIFEPFFTTKEQGKGTGLGLSTVYGIVKQSGGYIWVDSTPGAGTVFDIYLPRIMDDVEREEASDGPGADDEPVRTGGETVLVAEDEPLVRELVARVLEEAGYRVLLAEDGEDALDIARSFEAPIDLLITDLVMPRMGGRELLRELPRERPGMRSMLLTGYAERRVRNNPLPVDDVVIFTKPIKPGALLRSVREALDAPHGADV